jgi:hypothetical protein
MSVALHFGDPQYWSEVNRPCNQRRCDERHALFDSGTSLHNSLEGVLAKGEW